MAKYGGVISQVWVGGSSTNYGGAISQVWGGHQASMGRSPLGHQPTMGGHQPSMGGVISQVWVGGSSTKYG